MECTIHSNDENSLSVTYQMLMLSKKAGIEDSRFSRIGLDVGSITLDQTRSIHDIYLAKPTPPIDVSLIDEVCPDGSSNDHAIGYKIGGRMVSARVLDILEQPIINKADNPPPKPKGNGPKGPPQPRDGAGNRSADKKKPLENLGFSVLSLVVGLSGATNASPGRN